jgi:hypothetical protein
MVGGFDGPRFRSSLIFPVIRLPGSEFLIWLTLTSYQRLLGIFFAPDGLIPPVFEPRRRLPVGGCFQLHFAWCWRLYFYHIFIREKI